MLVELFEGDVLFVVVVLEGFVVVGFVVWICMFVMIVVVECKYEVDVNEYCDMILFIFIGWGLVVGVWGFIGMLFGDLYF